MSKVTVDLDELSCALESSHDCFINLKTGEVIQLPDPDDDYDNLFQEQRDEVESDADTYAKVDSLPSNIAFSIMEDFANQLADDNKAKASLQSALKKGSPFRRFKDALGGFSDVREQWFEFKEKQMLYWACWCLRKHDIDVDVVPRRTASESDNHKHSENS